MTSCAYKELSISILLIYLILQYSSWDDQQTSDFIEVKVNCLDPNNRRIKLHDLEAIKKISVELQSERNKKTTSDKEDTLEAEEDKQN